MQRWILGAALVGSLIFGAAAQAEEVVTTIGFDGIPAGTLLETVNGSDGAGPVAVSGLNPLVPTRNAALVFDSANPTGGDFDLGTPNETFGGPGVGEGGVAGLPTQNDTAQGEILIITDNFVDADGDGLIDSPDDDDQVGMVMSFDFTGITAPFTPDSVRVNSLVALDVEMNQGEENASVVLFGADDVILATVAIEDTGCNGKRLVDLGGVSGVQRMEIRLNGSGSIDDIELVLVREDDDEEPECGDCEGGVTELTLTYDGDEPALVQVVDVCWDVIFEGELSPGEEFTVVHPEWETLGYDLWIYVDGCYNACFVTNCSHPIFPGLSDGDFTVVSGVSLEGGPLCEEEPSSDDCGDCEGGVVELTFVYNGDHPAHIAVVDVCWDVIFCEEVAPGEEFTIVHPDWDTLGYDQWIYVDGCYNACFVTNCSRDVGPGYSNGDFTVVSGTSLYGGELCEYEEPDYYWGWGWGWGW